MDKDDIAVGRLMLVAFVLAAIILWFVDCFMELLWFNSESKDFMELVLPLDRPHEIYMRVLLVSTLLISGGVVSRMYGSLARSEREAKKSENHLRITFRSIGDAVIATDEKGKVTRMNPIAEKLTGWKASEASGKPLPEVFRIFNARTSVPCENPVEKVFNTKKIIGLANHTMLVSRSGKEYQISDSAAPIMNESGKIVGAVLVFRDVTEEYHQKEELRSLRNYLSNIVDSMPSVLVGVDADGQVTQWNMTAEKVTGVSSEEARGRGLSEVFPRMSSEMGKISESIRTRQAMHEQKKVRHLDDGIRYEDVTIFPLVANGVEGAVIQIDDVTEQFNLEQMMIQTEKMMSVGGLAAGMAHEINNPLAAIAGNTQNIKNRIYKDLKKNSDIACECDITLEGMREYLSKRDIPRMLDGISESCRRAAKIVSNMLRFSRKSEKRFSKCNLAELMDDTIDLAANDYDLKKEYDFRKITIVKEYSPSISEVYCEKNEIQQVLLNLLKNGAQAMNDKVYDDGKPCLTLRILSEGEMALIEVEDNGPGMSEEIRKRVFEPFYSTKSVGQGTGLGLSVSYFIIADQHNGTMDVDSLPGSWTKFTIRIPVTG